MASRQSCHGIWGACDSRPHGRSESSRPSGRRPMQTILNEGDQVRVFSRTAGEWVNAEVVQFLDGQYVRVEYELWSNRCGKMLHAQSDHLGIPREQRRWPSCNISGQSDTSSASEGEEFDPETTYCPNEAKSALGDFIITVQDGGCGSLLDMLTFEDNKEYEKHNAFSCRRPLQGSIHLEYNPRRANELVDVVLKVYARPAEDADNKYNYVEIAPYFVHTLVHKPHEKVTFAPAYSTYFLGLTVHKDLSLDLRDKMRASAADKEYIQGLIKRFKEGWNENGEARGETQAEDADYLISYTGKNKQENDEMLKFLSTEDVRGPHGFRPVRFCTDRSLGFGVHFHDFKHGESIGDLTALNLGKHGFAQPIAGNGWWGEYEHAAKRTQYGILVLNASSEYFSSTACTKEWKHIPEDLRCVWLAEEKRIVQWNDIKHDQAVTSRLLCTHPLHDAVKLDDTDALKRLLRKRANVDSKTVNGKTLLMEAAGYGYIGAVKLLLNWRASVNAKCSSRGSTALMVAAAYGHHDKAPEIVELLVNRRADVNATDDGQRTALDYCWDGKQGSKKQKMFGPRKKISGFLTQSCEK